MGPNTAGQEVLLVGATSIQIMLFDVFCDLLVENCTRCCVYIVYVRVCACVHVICLLFIQTFALKSPAHHVIILLSLSLHRCLPPTPFTHTMHMQVRRSNISARHQWHRMEKSSAGGRSPLNSKFAERLACERRLKSVSNLSY